jgi:DNA-binding MarR family transcriptional regulator
MAATAAETKARTGRNGARGAQASDPHREAWTALCRAHAGVTGRLQEALTDAGLPPLAWYEVLDRVEQAPDEGLRMGDLADSLVISRGGLTKLVDRLVKAGLLERAFCETDRRVSYAVVTASGREVIAEMRPVVLAELLTAFTPSLTTRQAAALRDALIKINTATCAP